jgi:tricorn protease
VLHGPIDRDVRLTVEDRDGKAREVTLRPVLFPIAQGMLYDKWVKDNRNAVGAMSKGTLGYLHIRGMNFPSFYRFEEEL